MSGQGFPGEDEDNFSIDLDNEAVLREKHARSEVLDRVAEFFGLTRANAQTTQEVMGMRNPVYREQKKRAIELTLLIHNSTAQIAQRNHDIINGRLSMNVKPLNPAKPWGPRDLWACCNLLCQFKQHFLRCSIFLDNFFFGFTFSNFYVFPPLPLQRPPI